MKIRYFFQPTIPKISSLSLLLLWWIIPTWKVATCKICWKQFHGFPYTFIILDKTGFGISSYFYSLDYFDISAAVLNIVVLYFFSCVIAYISYHFSNK